MEFQLNLQPLKGLELDLVIFTTLSAYQDQNALLTREMERNRKSASLIIQSVLIISIEKFFVLALIRSLEKVQKKTARHAKKAGVTTHFVIIPHFVIPTALCNTL